MNYIDKNIKSITQDKIIGIIISRKYNKFVIEYVSDKRIFNAMYILNWIFDKSLKISSYNNCLRKEKLYELLH